MNLWSSILLLFLCICCNCVNYSKDGKLLIYIERGPAEVSVWRKDNVTTTRYDSCQVIVKEMLRRRRLPETDTERNCASMEEMLQLLQSGRMEKQLVRAFFEEADIRRLPAGAFYSLEITELQSNIHLNYQVIENYTLFEGPKDASGVLELSIIKNGAMIEVCQCTRLSNPITCKYTSDCPGKSRKIGIQEPGRRKNPIPPIYVLFAISFILISLYLIVNFSGRTAACCRKNWQRRHEAEHFMRHEAEHFMRHEAEHFMRHQAEHFMRHKAEHIMRHKAEHIMPIYYYNRIQLCEDCGEGSHHGHRLCH